MTAKYKTFSPHAPWECPPGTGTASAEADGTWHLAATSNCKAPDNNTAWSCVVTSTITGMKAEGVMVRDGQDPNSAPYDNGPKLWARVKPECPICQPVVSVGDLDQGW